MTATGLRAVRNAVQISVIAGYFLISKTPEISIGPRPPAPGGGGGKSVPGVKRPERVLHHSYPSSVRLSLCASVLVLHLRSFITSTGQLYLLLFYFAVLFEIGLDGFLLTLTCKSL